MNNHLITEKSPYLQQHAHNPVDWYPWGQEAFDKARSEDRPIFLSIGYSTCHWCHVMERESFESGEVAEVLNRDFVSIKVDREERPDVDRIYMTFVQATTGSGGWPMSVFLTPDLKPFFGGTYFPPDNRYGRPGFKSLLEHVARAWRADRAKIDASSTGIVDQLLRAAGDGGQQAGVLDKAILDSAYHFFRRTFDQTHGGFGEAPKFPRPSTLNFLLRYYDSTKNPESLEMTLKTLRAMADGGMNDQIGGGFHRYSVDERWFVPHFEKMLYDQAQLAISYLEAFQITHDPIYAGVSRSIFEYVLRDLTAPEGGFYSAEDADSVIDPAEPKVKGEGAFYVWSQPEIQEILGKLAPIFLYRYGVEHDGNVRNDPHGEFTGKNILYARHSVAETAQNFGVEEDAARTGLATAIDLLMAARVKRIRPHLDDKVLTSWNALMISAFAKGAQVLDEPRYLAAAQRSAGFILAKLRDRAQTTLLRRYREGDAAVPGFLDDYAFFVAALLDLYEADFNPQHLETAIGLTDQMRDLFEDTAGGGFFTTAEGDDSLLLRMKDDYDGAEPSGNAIALIDLLRLAQITNRADYHSAAESTLRALSRRILTQPPAVPQMLVALAYSLASKRQVVLAGDSGASLTKTLLRRLHDHFLPNSITLLIYSEDTRSKLASLIPVIGSMREVDGQPTAYVCRNYVCQLPTNEVSKFVELLQ
jgi:uncharacterized protein YyaL (SSP411 family)